MRVALPNEETEIDRVLAVEQGRCSSARFVTAARPSLARSSNFDPTRGLRTRKCLSHNEILDLLTVQ